MTDSVAHWSAVGPADALDAEIIAWAWAHQSVVFTHDLDYSALLYLTGVQSPSVVQLRSEDVRPEQMEKIVIQALSQAATDLQRGALVTIEPHRFRIRSLPFEKPSPPKTVTPPSKIKHPKFFLPPATRHQNPRSRSHSRAFPISYLLIPISNNELLRAAG